MDPIEPSEPTDHLPPVAAAGADGPRIVVVVLVVVILAFFIGLVALALALT